MEWGEETTFIVVPPSLYQQQYKRIGRTQLEEKRQFLEGVTKMVTNMKVCPECDYWHTLVDGFWRHVRPEVECKYVETFRPASTVPTEVWNAISQVVDSRECQHCGEPTPEVDLDDIGNCQWCCWNEEPD
jgi:hypothetical protein